MDIEGRLHSEQRRSHITMMKFVQTVNADRLSDDESIRGRVRSQFAAGEARKRAGALVWGLAWLLACALTLALHAQAVPATGSQQIAFAGLRAVLNQGQPQGQINAVRVGATGNLYLLIDQKAVSYTHLDVYKRQGYARRAGRYRHSNGWCRWRVPAVRSRLCAGGRAALRGSPWE